MRGRPLGLSGRSRSSPDLWFWGGGGGGRDFVGAAAGPAPPIPPGLLWGCAASGASLHKRDGAFLGPLPHEQGRTIVGVLPQDHLQKPLRFGEPLGREGRRRLLRSGVGGGGRGPAERDTAHDAGTAARGPNRRRQPPAVQREHPPSVAGQGPRPRLLRGFGGGGGGGGGREVGLPFWTSTSLGLAHGFGQDTHLPQSACCGSGRALVVSTEPPDDLSCLTTPGVGRPGDGAVARAVDQGGRGGGGGSHTQTEETPPPPPAEATPPVGPASHHSSPNPGSVAGRRRAPDKTRGHGGHWGAGGGGGRPTRPPLVWGCLPGPSQHDRQSALQRPQRPQRRRKLFLIENGPRNTLNSRADGAGEKIFQATWKGGGV